MNQIQHLRTLSGASSAPGERTNWGSLLLLLTCVAGMALLFAVVFGNRLQPGIPVTATAALLIESDELASPDAADDQRTRLAQASGWVEPEPFPVRVPVKVDGFVESVLVYAGDLVQRGQLLAVLDSTDFALRVDRLTAALDEAQALGMVRRHEVDQARSDRRAAEAQQAGAEARHREAEDRLERIRTLRPGDVSEADVVAAERAAAEAAAASREARARLDRAEAAVAAHRAEEQRQAARVNRLQAELRQAQINLERTKIYAPMDGRVLERFAAPGMKRAAGMDDDDSATIVALYDPHHLQIRVDVPLADAGRIQIGTPATASTAVLPGQVFTGRVSRLTGKADITRNTLQVKVALDRPDPALRPDMLCRVEFFAPPGGAGQAGFRARQLWVPGAALAADSADQRATVWVVDPVTETVAPREIELGGRSPHGFRRVTSGLRPGERVVLESTRRLTPGVRVVVASEDSI